MKHLTDILEGYCDPTVKKHALHAIGETGLTTRVRVLGYYDGAIQSLLRPHVYEFGREHCYELYWPVLQMCRSTWLTEFMRIMDRARSFTPQGQRDNLTVTLLHERFQSDASISAAIRQTEARQYDALRIEYDSHSMWLFRCEKWFHLDLQQNLQPPQASGPSIHDLTNLIIEWYRAVGMYVFGADPAYVTQAWRSGRTFAGQFRRSMVSDVRRRKAGYGPDRWRHPARSIRPG